MPRVYTRRPPEERFWEKVAWERPTPTGCWLWQRGKPGAYGMFNVDGGKQLVRAHVWAYTWAYGPPPLGSVVRHTCDNPPCCNPEHLLAGSYKDNVDDMDARKRRVNGQLKGERHALHKLTEVDVAWARSVWGNAGKIGRSARGWTIARLAAHFGVASSTLHAALTGKTW